VSQRVGGEGVWDCLSFSVFLCVAGPAFNASNTKTTKDGKQKCLLVFNFVALYCVQETLCHNEWEVTQSGIASLSQSFCVSPVELLMHLILKLPRMESKISNRF
jgi:hypothetical protein